MYTVKNKTFFLHIDTQLSQHNLLKRLYNFCIALSMWKKKKVVFISMVYFWTFYYVLIYLHVNNMLFYCGVHMHFTFICFYIVIISGKQTFTFQRVYITRNIKPLHLPYYNPFQNSSYFSVDQIFIWYHFPSMRRFPSSFFVVWECWWKSLATFACLKMFFFTPPFLRDFCPLQTRLIVFNFVLKMKLYHLLSCMTGYTKKPAIIFTVVPLHKTSLFSMAAFKNLFLLLILNNLLQCALV